MATVDLVMPTLDINMQEATIVKWHKKPGDVVTLDEPVLEIASGKGDCQVSSTTEGTIEEILFTENVIVPVGCIIARIKTTSINEAEKAPPTKEKEKSPDEAAAENKTDKITPVVLADLCKTPVDEHTIRQLLAEVYYAAANDHHSNMLATAEVLEFIRKELLQAHPLTFWSRLSLNRTNFEQPFLTPLLVRLKSDYSELLYQALTTQIRDTYQADEAAGWRLWLQYYIAALVQWKNDIYARLCRDPFPHPSSKEQLVLKFNQLNEWIFDSRWSDCYNIYQDLLQCEEIPVEHKIIIEVILGQIQLYWFPDYKDSIKQFEKAKSMLQEAGLPNTAKVERAFAEYYLKLAQNDQGRSHIFNAMSLDNGDIENYHLMGDSYRDEGNTEVAEQWYNDAINFNFLDASSHAKFFALFNDETYFEQVYAVKDNPEKKQALTIEELIEKIAQLEPDSNCTNTLYDAYRSAGNAYFINNQIAQSEKYYRHAIDMHPGWTAAYIDLAYVLGSSHQTAQTDRLFSEVATLDKDSFNLNWNLAWWQEQKGDLEKALDYYLTCIRIRPQWSHAIYQNLEDLYLKHNRYDELVTFYESEVAKAPNKDNRLRLAYSYEKNKQSALAENQYREVLQLDEEDAATWNRLGNLYYDKLDFTTAISYY